MKKIDVQKLLSRSERPKCFSFTNHSAKLTGRPVCSNFVPGFRKSGLCVPTLFLASESQACVFQLCSWLQKIRPVFQLCSWLQKVGPVCSNFVRGFKKLGLCVPAFFLASESQACVFQLCSWLQKVRPVCSNFVPGFIKLGLCVPTLFVASES